MMFVLSLAGHAEKLSFESDGINTFQMPTKSYEFLVIKTLAICPLLIQHD